MVAAGEYKIVNLFLKKAVGHAAGQKNLVVHVMKGQDRMENVHGKDHLVPQKKLYGLFGDKYPF
ncbi:MAG TPA: hypothetical protein DE038_07505 [Nitrospina sp.]|nr:hypothetical protein [Nitrospina sp.]